MNDITQPRRFGRWRRTAALAAALATSAALVLASATAASAAATSCRQTVFYDANGNNGLAWSVTYGYWYTPGILYAGNCGAVWVYTLGFANASEISGQAGRYRLRTYNGDGSIHDAFPWTACHNEDERFDVRATAPGDISTGRGFRVYAENCNPIYDGPGQQPGMVISAGQAIAP